MYLVFRIKGEISLRKQENVFNIQDQGCDVSQETRECI